LAIHHEGPEARVVSFLPDAGRVTVVARIAGDYLIRIPGFVPWNSVRAFRGRAESQQVEVIRKGEYVVFPNAEAGEELTVSYPLVDFVQKTKAGGKELEIRRKGNLVIGLSPSGTSWPLFDEVPDPTPPFRPLGRDLDESLQKRR
jgi:hypothetical protein